MTVREALRDAMAEEMRNDEDRLPDGRRGCGVSGCLQGERRACWTNLATGASSIHRSPNMGFTGIAVGAAFNDLQADR